MPVDVSVGDHYVARVTVLLLLSALLSALTGVGEGARQPQVVFAVVQQVRAASVRSDTAPTVTRPVQGLPALADVAMPPQDSSSVFAGAEPLYAARLRE